MTKPSSAKPRTPKATATAHDTRWAQVLARDPKADGTFYYAVSTTGIYCNPSCASRAALPKHVTFFSTCAAAEAAGFRACKRCQPQAAPLTQRHAELVASLCRLIEAAPTAPSLQALAAHAGLSVFHMHRMFKARTGVTPMAYAAQIRRQRLHAGLRQEGAITDAMYEAGYNSSGQFYAQAQQALGMTPTAFRAGGEAMEIRFTTTPCALGVVLVAATPRGICAILLGDDAKPLADDLARRFPKASLLPPDGAFDKLVAQVVAALEQPQRAASLPLDVRGTAFQERVWQALRQVAPGTTISYAELALAIGAPTASRAVAQACGANPLAVAIPCHRVVRADGGLSGYRWGVQRKRELLLREGAMLRDNQPPPRK